jgi:TPR repeat protein
MNNLGLLYMSGQGVPRDYDEARRLFEQGAALGNDASMNNLGLLYNQGHGVPQSTGWPGNFSRRPPHSAIKRQKKTCGECRDDAARVTVARS